MEGVGVSITSDRSMTPAIATTEMIVSVPQWTSTFCRIDRLKNSFVIQKAASFGGPATTEPAVTASTNSSGGYAEPAISGSTSAEDVNTVTVAEPTTMRTSEAIR